jgi:CRISPR-associated protein Cas5d
MSGSALSLYVEAPYALFSRPEMRVERVSYDVPTPSAARGVLEAILWKPEMQWRVTAIRVLRPIQMMSLRRNEVGSKAAVGTLDRHRRAGTIATLDPVAERQQRASLVLRDVAYVIDAAVELTSRAGPGDSVTKYVEMFKRRAAAGQCAKQPYLGCREFSVHRFRSALASDCPIALNQDLGWMLHDFDYARPSAPQPRFFRARMEGGVIVVPHVSSPEVVA